MKNGNLLFFINNSLRYETTAQKMMAIPDIDDIVEFPSEENSFEFESDCYHIFQKKICPDCIKYFCEPYDWHTD